MSVWGAARRLGAARTPHPFIFLRNENGPIGPKSRCQGRGRLSRGPGKGALYQILAPPIGPIGPIGPKSAGSARAVHLSGSGVKNTLRKNPVIFGPIGPIGPDPPFHRFNSAGCLWPNSSDFGPFFVTFGPIGPLRKRRNQYLLTIWGNGTTYRKRGSSRMVGTQTRRVKPGRSGKREVSIWELLVWAFQVERVSIDFDEMSSAAGERPGISMEYVLMVRGNLGCEIDGGGRSDPHPDADLIASAVAALPEMLGGRRMAVSIAEAARLGVLPVWSLCEPASCQPVEWKQHWRGRFAKTAIVDGRLLCPVRYRNTSGQMATLRRDWLLFYGALSELRVTFQMRRDLTAFAVVDDMPPRAPWQNRLDRK